MTWHVALAPATNDCGEQLSEFKRIADCWVGGAEIASSAYLEVPLSDAVKMTHCEVTVRACTVNAPEIDPDGTVALQQRPAEKNGEC